MPQGAAPCRVILGKKLSGGLSIEKLAQGGWQVTAFCGTTCHPLATGPEVSIDTQPGVLYGGGVGGPRGGPSARQGLEKRKEGILIGTLARTGALSTEHAASRRGQPVLVHRSTGEAYNPDDLLYLYGHPPFKPLQAVSVVARLASSKLLEAEERALVERFTGIPSVT